MYASNIFTDERDAQAEQRATMGKIGAMKDEMVVSFTFRGLKINHEGEFIVVRDMQTDSQLGMKIHERNWSVAGIYEWIMNKAEHYGRA